MVYVTVERTSVCLINRPPHAAATGLLLWARMEWYIDRLLHAQPGPQQHMRAVSRCQLTHEAKHRLYAFKYSPTEMLVHKTGTLITR